MGILPKIIEDNIANKTKEENKIIKQGQNTYIIDFKNKKMRYENGKPLVNNLEVATKMYIQKLLLTELKKWKYHKNYGTIYVDETYGKRYSNVFHRANIENNLIEQLLKYDNILNVYSLKIKQQGNTLNISFTVILKNNNIIEWTEDIAI